MNGNKLRQKFGYEHLALVVLAAGSEFPIDCLRYDCAMPWREEDSRPIADSLNPYMRGEMAEANKSTLFRDAPFTVMIVRRFSELVRPMWSINIWESHSGVFVIPISHDEGYAMTADGMCASPERVQRVMNEIIYKLAQWKERRKPKQASASVTPT